MFYNRQAYLLRVKIPHTFIKYHKLNFWSWSISGKKSTLSHSMHMQEGASGEESEAAQSTGQAHSFLGSATGDPFGTLRSSGAVLQSRWACCLHHCCPQNLAWKCPQSAVKALLEVGWAGVGQATALRGLVVHLTGIYTDHIRTSHEHPRPRPGLCPEAPQRTQSCGNDLQRVLACQLSLCGLQVACGLICTVSQRLKPLGLGSHCRNSAGVAHGKISLFIPQLTRKRDISPSPQSTVSIGTWCGNFCPALSILH